MNTNNQYAQANLRTIDGRTTAGRFEVRNLSTSERFKGAGFWMSIYWLAIIPVIPIPFVHAVVPPILLVTGVVAFVRVFQIRQRIGQSEAKCPSCGASFALKGTKFSPKIKETCPGCGFGVYVEFA